MSEQNLPEKDYNLQIPQEAWSVSRWHQVTKQWHEENKTLVKILRDIPFKERRISGGNLFEIRDTFEDPEHAEFTASLCSFNNEILDRVIQSFYSEHELEYYFGYLPELHPQDEDRDIHYQLVDFDPKIQYAEFRGVRGYRANSKPTLEDTTDIYLLDVTSVDQKTDRIMKRQRYFRDAAESEDATNIFLVDQKGNRRVIHQFIYDNKAVHSIKVGVTEKISKEQEALFMSARYDRYGFLDDVSMSLLSLEELKEKYPRGQKLATDPVISTLLDEKESLHMTRNNYDTDVPSRFKVFKGSVSRDNTIGYVLPGDIPEQATVPYTFTISQEDNRIHVVRLDARDNSRWHLSLLNQIPVEEIGKKAKGERKEWTEVPLSKLVSVHSEQK